MTLIQIDCKKEDFSIEHIAEMSVEKRKAKTNSPDILLKNVGTVSIMNFIKQITGGLFDIQLPVQEVSSGIAQQEIDISIGKKLRLPDGKIVLCNKIQEGTEGRLLITYK